MNLNLSSLRILPSAYLRTGSWYMPFGRRPEGPVRAPLIKPGQTIVIPEDAQPGTILGRLTVFFKPSSVVVDSADALVLIDANGVVTLLREPNDTDTNTIVVTALNSKGASRPETVTLDNQFDAQPAVEEDDWFAPPLSFAPGMPL